MDINVYHLVIYLELEPQPYPIACYDLKLFQNVSFIMCIIRYLGIIQVEHWVSITFYNTKMFTFVLCVITEQKHQNFIAEKKNKIHIVVE